MTELTGDADSRAEVRERFGKEPIEAGAQAVVLGNTDQRLQRVVGLALEDSALRKALQAAIQEHGAGFIRLAGANEALDFQVALDEKVKTLEIWDRKGSALPNLRPEVKAADPGSAERIAKRLVHLAKYFNVQALTGPESDFSRKISLELAGAPAEGAEGGTPVYAPGTNVKLKLTNNLIPNPQDINDPTRILNITVLDLQADWGITQIFPSSAGAFEILQPGKSRELKFKTFLPEGYSETTDVLKVFATQRTTNFRWLELPALDQVPKARDTRSPRGEITDPLERMMSAIVGDQAPSQEEVRTRSVALLAEPGEEKTWAVAQVDMCVKKA